jgi:hypothetical protein
MKAFTTDGRLPMALGALALLTIGVGLYMAFLRPPLLPEDLCALGVDGQGLTVREQRRYKVEDNANRQRFVTTEPGRPVHGLVWPTS